MKLLSFKIRFLSTFLSNVLRMSISFVTGIVIARNLGPGEYGDFNFLLGSFMSLTTLVDMASSSAFYTFISQKPRGKKFFVYYASWVMSQLVILFLIVLLLPDSIREKIWIGHSFELILLGLIVNFSMNKLWGFWAQIGESIRDTVVVQIRNLTLAIAYLIGVGVLVGFHVINIKNLFILNIILYFLFSALYGFRICQQGLLSNKKTETFKAVLMEFKTYCLPLIIFSIVGFLYSFLDYWLLQKFGGAEQQGYYAIGARFSTLSLIATTSMLQVFWKEIAEANSLGNMERVRQLYHKVSRSLYFFSAVISCIMIPFSQEILSLLLGPAYKAAWLPLSLMFLYPVHQSLGQINGTMLYSLGKTKSRSVVGLVNMGISIPIVFVLLAPRSAIIPGLQLGATGLALKMVGCQIFATNLMSLYVCRYIKVPFRWGYQFSVILLLLPIAFLSKYFIPYILFFDRYILFSMVVSGGFYLIIVMMSVFFFPSIAGLNRNQIHNGFIWVRAIIHPGLAWSNKNR